ncbi:MAG: hypothetical protein P4L55_20855 [Syntrophobacteraceae bacterium]|nr:hypothetical protein [Syntrophobacteraceae bacterium]
MGKRVEVIESTAGQVAAELARRGYLDFTAVFIPAASTPAGATDGV